ncbi:MAG: phosphotransferase [Candidatus Cyclobacteriaceae bacterium M3_2C_046]
MAGKQLFKSKLPHVFYLEKDIPSLSAFLQQNHRIPNDEKTTRLEKPGEGNMNFVLRVITNQRSFIIKQSRPWVEKYPHVAAPVDRIKVEAAYYELIQTYDPLSTYSPHLLFFEKEHFLLAMEDLGQGSDYTFLYRHPDRLSSSELDQLVDYISHLHHLKIQDFPPNQSMKELNHEHIFHFPFQLNNGINLDDVTPGLREIANTFQTDQALHAQVKELGQRYLAQGKTLIHGDYYPGSWLKVKSGVKVIDPEFAYLGSPAFDLGVMAAHFMMSGISADISAAIFNKYNQPEDFDPLSFIQFCGIEILRRILGLAQLPLILDLKQKKGLLEKAREMVMSPRSNELNKLFDQ